MLSKNIKNRNVVSNQKLKTCDKILNEKCLWALDVDRVEKDLQNLSANKKSIEENFVYYFIQKKINYIYIFVIMHR